MVEIRNLTNCEVREHVLLAVLTNEILLKIDPVGVFGDTQQFSEYLPEVPYLVDMIANDQITSEGILAIFDHFFGSNRIAMSSVDALFKEAVKVRELWLLNVEKLHSGSSLRRAACKAFAQAWTMQCRVAYCRCTQCTHLLRLMPDLGITYASEDRHGASAIDFYDLGEYWTGEVRPDAIARRDVVSFLNTMRQFNCLENPNILEGWQEIPETVGRVHSEGNWRTRLREIEDLEPNDYFRVMTIQEFIEDLVRAAITDDYFDSLT